ncbi:MAG: hypothetical protein ACRDJE_28405, partial [Dehalococcoidia bacterium]
WATLAQSAAVSASPDAINRALSRLANEGLIDGLCTPTGWYQVRPSARGLSRAGNAARRPAVAAATPAPDADQRSRGARLTERVSASWVQLQAELRIVRAASVTAWQRSTRAVSPRLSALRTTMAETWRMFTSFP